MDINYELIRSSRKTLSLEVKPDGRVIVRAPMRLKQSRIDKFVSEKRGWLDKQLKKLEDAKQRQGAEKLTPEELRALSKAAKEYIPGRVEYYAAFGGISYGRIFIRTQKTKWGSCSAAGNLNFNCLLMLAPKEVIDSVVVHELCHRRVMNHSAEFYAEVERLYPEYRKHNRWLKENGPAIMSRVF